MHKFSIKIRKNYPLSVFAISLIFATYSAAYEQYNNGCADCHGAFTDAVSTKGSVFPSDNKHEMHRDSSYMNTDCSLCHSSGDRKDPYIGYSTGTAANPGLGCTGCHTGPGLRLHHAANNVSDCADCHDPETSPAENVKPPYYGTVDTLADYPANDVLASNTNENWTIGDFIGLDNDGNNLYDAADFACGEYRVTSIAIVGGDVVINWKTAGGRRDVLQHTSSLSNAFTDVSAARDISGVGVVETNYVHSGAAGDSTGYYRVRYAP